MLRRRSPSLPPPFSVAELVEEAHDAPGLLRPVFLVGFAAVDDGDVGVRDLFPDLVRLLPRYFDQCCIHPFLQNLREKSPGVGEG